MLRSAGSGGAAVIGDLPSCRTRFRGWIGRSMSPRSAFQSLSPISTAASSSSVRRDRALRSGSPAKGKRGPVAGIDVGFVLAVVALGWGLSLATYRLLATACRWPMGAWQQHRPGLPIGLGSLSILLAALFALARACGGHWLSAAAILVFGLAWAVFWTGFLRVGAQSALLLAPAAGLLLVLRWLSRAQLLAFG